jgi:hypothetical protein
MSKEKPNAMQNDIDAQLARQKKNKLKWKKKYKPVGARSGAEQRAAIKSLKSKFR